MRSPIRQPSANSTDYCHWNQYPQEPPEVDNGEIVIVKRSMVNQPRGFTPLPVPRGPLSVRCHKATLLGRINNLPLCRHGLTAQAPAAACALSKGLFIEWLKNEAGPGRYVLSTLPEQTPIKELVRAARQRWRIARDCQDLKQNFGLGHHDGRGWRGLHHHAALSTARPTGS